VLAERQTAGRGSHGRHWESPAGNLYLSALLRPDVPAAQAGRLALMAAVALAEALAPHAPDLTLKWPNDVLRDGAKLAGILTDSEAAPDGSLGWVIFGIGVNLAHAPAVPDRRTTCIGAAAPSPPAFAATLLARIAHWYGRATAEGFAPVRAAWLARAHAPGTPLRLRRPDGVIEGRFAGLAEDGRLLLADAAGHVQAHGAGEIA
jgi:BirA family biotin operon repressor/biotin-[acetyl-CoA-carboxylase] ligase